MKARFLPLPILALPLAQLVLAACGGEPPRASAEDGSSGGVADGVAADSVAGGTGAGGSMLAEPRFAVEGRGESGKTSAVLEVVEGEEGVSLSITGADASDNILVINVTFAGVDAVVGSHTLPIGPIDAADAFAVGSVDGRDYQSLSGELELSLSADRHAEGTFRLGLATSEQLTVALPSGSSGPAAVVPAADVSLTLSGSFESEWQVTCYSFLRGFTGGHFVTDSPYCNSLAFE